MSTAPTDFVVIRSPIFTRVDLEAQISVLLAAPVCTFLILFLTTGGPSHDFQAKLGLLIGVLVATDLLLEAINPVRRVDIDPSGITFGYLFHKERGNWDELSPGMEPARHGIWQVVRATKRGSRRGHRITVGQARAIILHPAAPKWALGEQVLTSLGLQETLRAASPGLDIRGGDKQG